MIFWPGSLAFFHLNHAWLYGMLLHPLFPQWPLDLLIQIRMKHLLKDDGDLHLITFANVKNANQGH